MTDQNEMKFTGKFDAYKGDLTINVLEMIENLTDEQKHDLVSDAGWWSFITDDMAEKIINEFSRDCYNEIYTKLRGLILTSESMPDVIKNWAISLIESRERAKERESYWNNAYWALYHWTRDNMVRSNRDIDYFKPPSLPKDSYGRPYTDEFMKEVEENVKTWMAELDAKQGKAK